MKTLFTIWLVLLSLFCCFPVFAEGAEKTGKKDYEMIAPESYEGYWEDKEKGRLLMSVSPADEPGWFDVTVAVRNKLPKIDVFMMRAHYQTDGSLKYDNCLYVIRKIKSDGTVKDKIKKHYGAGLLYYNFDENVLYWNEKNVKPEKTARAFIKTASPDTDETM